MSGDLEDFLRRAAQRRREKATEVRRTQGASTAGGQRPRSAPQYSNIKTERLARPEEVDEVVLAEVVEDDETSIAARLRRLEASKRAAAEAEAELAGKRQPHAAGADPGRRDLLISGNPAQDLLNLLRQPGGIRQAVLLKEVLDRPEHRW